MKKENTPTKKETERNKSSILTSSKSVDNWKIPTSDDIIKMSKHNGIAKFLINKIGTDLSNNNWDCKVSNFDNLRKQLDIDYYLNKSIKKCFTDGFCLIYLGFTDSGNFEDAVEKTQVAEFLWFIPKSKILNDIDTSNNPEHYIIRNDREEQFQNIKIHKSRILRVNLEDEEDPLLLKVWRPLQVIDENLYSSGQMMYRASRNFFHFKVNNPKKLKDGKDEIQLLSESDLINELNARNNFISSERYNVENVSGSGKSFSNISEYFDNPLQLIATSMNIPLQMLKGTEAGAISGSETNIKEYLLYIHKERERIISKIMKEMLERFGYTDIEFIFNDIYEETKQEKIERQNKELELIEKAANTGVKESELIKNFNKENNSEKGTDNKEIFHIGYIASKKDYTNEEIKKHLELKSIKYINVEENANDYIIYISEKDKFRNFFYKYEPEGMSKIFAELKEEQMLLLDDDNIQIGKIYRQEDYTLEELRKELKLKTIEYTEIVEEYGMYFVYTNDKKKFKNINHINGVIYGELKHELKLQLDNQVYKIGEIYMKEDYTLEELKEELKLNAIEYVQIKESIFFWEVFTNEQKDFFKIEYINGEIYGQLKNKLQLKLDEQYEQEYEIGKYFEKENMTKEELINELKLSSIDYIEIEETEQSWNVFTKDKKKFMNIFFSWNNNTILGTLKNELSLFLDASQFKKSKWETKRFSKMLNDLEVKYSSKIKEFKPVFDDKYLKKSIFYKLQDNNSILSSEIENTVDASSNKIIKELQDDFDNLFNVGFALGNNELIKKLNRITKRSDKTNLIKDELLDNSFNFVKDMSTNMKKDLRFNLFEYIKNNKSVKEIREEFDNYFDTEFKDKYTNRIKTIVRNESIGILNTGNFRNYVDSGVVKKIQWITAGDERVRSSHRILHGKIVKLGNKFDNGSLTPPDGVNCRCSVIPVE